MRAERRSGPRHGAVRAANPNPNLTLSLTLTLTLTLTLALSLTLTLTRYERAFEQHGRVLPQRPMSALLEGLIVGGERAEALRLWRGAAALTLALTPPSPNS